MGVVCQSNELEAVRRMGQWKENKIRPINFTMTTYGNKILILKNKKKLEQTKLYIKEDFSPEILEVRKTLQEQLQKERNEGKIAYIKYDKIVVRESTQNKQYGPLASNSKKRELAITPPHQTVNLTGNTEGQDKPQFAKKNKVYRGNQSSISNFIQKRNGSQNSGASSSNSQ
ncbi:putative endonuclease-reverse transcriptase [Operophtera brumata]|uniref:Putative endonuclease-reverse transcriptase n=1 Tax=Operophtera brumata TaxID=104452 RepID=A0A0L7LKX6_OPEBR|nr:putative endonuclease-reverse transcriptase [Operophtera brumata]